MNQLLTAQPPYDTKTNANIFSIYKINTSNSVYKDKHLRIYKATGSNYPDFPIMVRIYSCQDLDPNNSLYLKMLTHLGRKYSKIPRTFDIFFDDKNVYVFQEYMRMGNLLVFLGQNPPVSEKQAQFWAKDVFDALDFLGDQAISHRNITPYHLLVKVTGNKLEIKLTGFHDSIIYWDVNNDDIQYCPCWPAQNQKNRRT